MSEQAIDSAPTDLHCTVCGVELTAGEVDAAREAALPMLCTTHLVERAPVDVPPEDDPPPPA
jgi:hypothetical protein